MVLHFKNLGGHQSLMLLKKTGAADLLAKELGVKPVRRLRRRRQRSRIWGRSGHVAQMGQIIIQKLVKHIKYTMENSTRPK